MVEQFAVAVSYFSKPVLTLAFEPLFFGSIELKGTWTTERDGKTMKRRVGKKVLEELFGYKTEVRYESDAKQGQVVAH